MSLQVTVSVTAAGRRDLANTTACDGTAKCGGIQVFKLQYTAKGHWQCGCISRFAVHCRARAVAAHGVALVTVGTVRLVRITRAVTHWRAHGVRVSIQVPSMSPKCQLT